MTPLAATHNNGRAAVLIDGTLHATIIGGDKRKGKKEFCFQSHNTKHDQFGLVDLCNMQFDSQHK